ncbi:MAG: GNAT family N-acetyltransferase, partial [Armatimonadetes bacterium]|nr:GNAT family N-acetyltransferase [Armatimonadota bacterium]
DAAVADALLREFEAAARRLGVRELHVAGSAPNYFLPGIDPRDTLTLNYYLDRGFERLREAFNMTADLTASNWATTAEEQALEAEGIACRRLRLEDRPALAEFMRAYFSEGWLTETCLGYQVEPVTVQVAWHQQRIVAFAAAEVTNPGWFGPMGTAPDYRRHGLGRILLRRCLADLRALGYREAQIGWVGPLGFYARHCGARVSRVFWMLRRELAD